MCELNIKHFYRHYRLLTGKKMCELSIEHFYRHYRLLTRTDRLIQLLCQGPFKEIDMSEPG